MEPLSQLVGNNGEFRSSRETEKLRRPKDNSLERLPAPMWGHALSLAEPTRHKTEYASNGDVAKREDKGGLVIYKMKCKVVCCIDTRK
jgi:hypothetical protein